MATEAVFLPKAPTQNQPPNTNQNLVLILVPESSTSEFNVSFFATHERHIRSHA